MRKEINKIVIKFKNNKQIVYFIIFFIKKS